jgi:hypothetical protein
MQSSKNLPTFRSKVLLPFSGEKLDTLKVGGSTFLETSVNSIRLYDVKYERMASLKVPTVRISNGSLPLWAASDRVRLSSELNTPIPEHRIGKWPSAISIPAIRRHNQKYYLMPYNRENVKSHGITQNCWAFGLCRSSDNVETRKHDVSETGCFCPQVRVSD